MRPLAHLFLFLAFLAPAHAWADSANWNVVAEKSSVTFSATQVGQSFTGKFKTFNAEIRFDPADLANASVIATIDMGSVDADDNQRNAALPTADWFNISAFPTAQFKSGKFESLGENRYQATGTLNIRGVERDVILPFSLSIVGDQATMQGELTIARTAFGVGQGQWQSGQWVGLDVKIAVAITATRLVR